MKVAAVARSKRACRVRREPELRVPTAKRSLNIEYSISQLNRLPDVPGSVVPFLADDVSVHASGAASYSEITAAGWRTPRDGSSCRGATP